MRLCINKSVSCLQMSTPNPAGRAIGQCFTCDGEMGRLCPSHPSRTGTRLCDRSLSPTVGPALYSRSQKNIYIYMCTHSQLRPCCQYLCCGSRQLSVTHLQLQIVWYGLRVTSGTFAALIILLMLFWIGEDFSGLMTLNTYSGTRAPCESSSFANLLFSARMDLSIDFTDSFDSDSAVYLDCSDLYRRSHPVRLSASKSGLRTHEYQVHRKYVPYMECWRSLLSLCQGACVAHSL